MNRLFLGVFVSMLTITTFASSESCSIKDANEFLDLIKKNHHEIHIAETKRDLWAGGVETADTSYNPKIISEASTNKDNDIESEFKIMQRFELGGKRDARTKLAIEKQKLGEVQIQNTKENIVLNSVLDLYRLRQINQVIPLYEEAYSSFNKLLKKKKKLENSLSPTQEVEYETLSLALDEYFLKLTELKTKRNLLLGHLKLDAGGKCRPTLKSLPVEFNFTDTKISSLNLNESTEYKIRKAELMAAKSQYEVAKSSAYSDLEIGPVYEFSKNKGEKEHAFGLRLTFDLPILNTNDGNKAQGLALVKEAEHELHYQEIDLKMDYQNWLSKYKLYLQVYKKIASIKSLEKKHRRIEKLFERGIISTSTIIESHKQLIDFKTRRNEYELGAVEALWNLYKVRGSILKERI